MNEPHCRCPGCGECSAHKNESKLKTKIKNERAAGYQAGLDAAAKRVRERNSVGAGWGWIVEITEQLAKEIEALK